MLVKRSNKQSTPLRDDVDDSDASSSRDESYL